MNEKDRDEFDRAMRKVDSQVKHRVDSKLVELRQIYQSLNPDQRSELRAWIDTTLDTEKNMPRIPLNINLSVELEEKVGDDEFVQIKLPLLALKNAFASWDFNEPYTPRSMAELFG